MVLIIMKRIVSGRFVFLASLCLAGAVMSQKSPPPVTITQTMQNNSRLMGLEWESWPGRRYAVETSTAIGGWETIASGLEGPTGIGKINYKIPDTYLFDPKRFFRVRIEPKP